MAKLADGEADAIALPTTTGDGEAPDAADAGPDIALERRVSELERRLRDKDELLARERHLQDDLAQGQSATQRFLVMLSHDLRAPVNAILGWASLLQREHLDHGGRTRAVATIERNARVQVALLEALLDISRITAGKLHIDLACVDVFAVAREVLESLTAAALERGVTTCLQGDQGDHRVLADATRLRQVVTNLLLTALRSTPTGGRIDVDISRKDGSVRLAVRDSKGVLPELLHRAFAFHDEGVDPASSAALDLYIARRLVQVHGGKVRAESDGDRQGPALIVELPARDTAQRPSTTASEPLPKGLHGTRVLVVDDEPDARELLATLLRQHGADVVVAADVPTALDLFDGWRADVVISDLVLPSQDGYSLLRDLRTRFGYVPVIAISAFTGSGRASEVLSAGFDQFMQKPLDLSKLVSGLEALARTAGVRATP